MLIGVLLRFREHPVALMADMFYQVKVPEEDANLLRFLWWPEGDFDGIERVSKVKDMDISHNTLPMERALGVQWCTETDNFKFQIIVQDKPVTRHGILSTASSSCDLLGFLALLMLSAKLILRGLCKGKHGWDEEIENEHAKIRREWLSNLSVSRI